MSVVAAEESRPSHWGAAAQAPILIVLTLAVLFARRPDQFLHPAIWGEDGTFVLKAFAERGALSIFDPVSGYRALASNLIAVTAFKISFAWAPEIALALTVAFTCVVVVAVALSPTHLRWPFLCAIAVLTIPTAPEVFAVSLHAGWWAGLLLLLALLWKADRGPIWLRAGYVVLGGLSSPLSVPLAGLFILRAVRERRPSEHVIASIALGAALIQLVAILSHHQLHGEQLIDPRSLLMAANKLAGTLFAGPRFDGYYPGPLLLLILAVLAWRVRDRLTPFFALLVLAWIATLATTLLNVPVDAIDPRYGMPRYYFYPLIALTWIVIWIAALSRPPIRIFLAIGCVLGVAWVFRWMTSRHDPVDWRAHVAACARAERYDLPIHFGGRTNSMRTVTLTGAQCRDLIAGSLTRR